MRLPPTTLTSASSCSIAFTRIAWKILSLTGTTIDESRIVVAQVLSSFTFPFFIKRVRVTFFHTSANQIDIFFFSTSIFFFNPGKLFSWTRSSCSTVLKHMPVLYIKWARFYARICSLAIFSFILIQENKNILTTIPWRFALWIFLSILTNVSVVSRIFFRYVKPIFNF